MTEQPHEPPHDEITAEPPVFGDARHSVLSPSGEYESMRDFARGLGPHRLRVALFVAAGVVLVLALLDAVR